MANGIELSNTKVLSDNAIEKDFSLFINKLIKNLQPMQTMLIRLFSTDLDNVANDNIIWCIVLAVTLLVLTLVWVISYFYFRRIF